MMRRIAIALGALLALAVPAQPAAAFIYWGETNYDPLTGAVARANPAGVGVNERFIVRKGEYVGPVEVDSNHVYWVETSGEFDPATIARARLDGTHVQADFIRAGNLGAVDSSYVYSAINPYLCPARGCDPDYQEASIDRTGIDGIGGVDEGFVSGFEGPIHGIAVDSTHIYWTKCADDDPAAIGRANLDGTGVEAAFIPLADPAACPVDVAVDGKHLYWTNEIYYSPSSAPNYTISRAGLDGTQVEPSFIAYGAASIAVDAGHVYWAGDSIGRAGLDGTGVDGAFITPAEPLPILNGLAVDALSDANAPKTKLTKGAPAATEKHKLTFKFKSSEPNSTFECKLDHARWKRCDSPRTVKRLNEGKHRFRVRAIDAAMSADRTPVVEKFKVLR